MAEHGGYRAPAKPAPASGPGRLSKRTDGGPAQKMRVMTDQPYGDREAALQQERSAPMSQADAVHAAQVPTGAGPSGPAAPFGAPTARPGEPVTHGADIGPGGGPEVLGIPGAGQQPTGYLTAVLSQMAPADMTGTLAKLLVIAKQRNV